LKPEDENELTKAFKEQIILDRDLEKSKIDLVDTCYDFNLFDAFRLLDKDAKGYLTSFDIKDAFDNPRAIDLPHLTLEDIELIIARYDRDNDRRIKFSEFTSAFSPIDPFYKEKLIQRKA
jgi:hypothetical protein